MVDMVNISFTINGSERVECQHKESLFLVVIVLSVKCDI